MRLNKFIQTLRNNNMELVMTSYHVDKKHMGFLIQIHCTIVSNISVKLHIANVLIDDQGALNSYLEMQLPKSIEQLLQARKIALEEIKKAEKKKESPLVLPPEKKKKIVLTDANGKPNE